jgi:flagellar basal-body rod modification protein FlgD
MTTVSNVSNTGTSSVATAPTSQPAFGQEFNSFIKLLTAQVRNQDPLSPLDSTQFVEQLATFSSLEQQVNTNTNLKSISTMISDLARTMTAQSPSQALSLQSSWLPFSGDSVQFSGEIPAGTSRGVLTIKNESGQAVWTETLGIGAGVYSWDGRTTSGSQAPTGDLYEYSIDTYNSAGEYTGSVAPRPIL